MNIIVSLKKLSKVLSSIIIILILTLIVVNILLFSYSSKKAAEYTYTVHSENTIDNIDNFGNLLKAAAEKVANNNRIISLLDKHRNIESFSEEDKLDMTYEIDLSEKIVNTISFIRTVNIVSLQGKYLFSNKTLYDNFDLTKRPWFKPEFLTNHADTVISEVHTNFTNGKYAISIIQFIYSEYEPLGAVILDIYLEDFLQYVDKYFKLGVLNSYIPIDQETFISKNGVVNSEEVFKPENVFYVENAFKNKLLMVFAYDKNSLIYSQTMENVNKTITIMFIIVGIALCLILLRFTKVTFKPIMNSLDKLKVLLKNLEKNNFHLELTDEFQQLEFISESLSKSLDKKIHSLIYYDDLTSLPNRKMLLKLCNELINGKKPFALIFIDLNKFKYINDAFGHSTGDSLLTTFSETLTELFTGKGVVTRYSGDEFVVIYENYTDDDKLINFYDSVILDKFKQPLYFNDTNTLVQFSSGVALYPKDGETFDELIRKSDFMMYRSKKHSTFNKLQLFNDEIYNKIKRIEDIKVQLKKAIEKNEFFLLYQPIIDENKSIKKVEALLRWKNDSFGLVSPDEFIPYAEEIGEIIPIGYWIIEEICKAFVPIFQSGVNLQLSINVSPLQLLDVKFIDKIRAIIEGSGMNYSNLCFEITESVVLHESPIVFNNITALHNLGIHIALDDFGTGYSCFSYLNKYKLNILKIDKLFIEDTESKNFSIVEHLQDIAHQLDMSVVIEGVETEEQFVKLAEMNCDYFQGYYFSKPLNFEDFKKLLLEQ